jgi:Na+/phosphate symporter
VAFLKKWYERVMLYAILAFIIGYTLTVILVVRFVVGGAGSWTPSPLATLITILIFFNIPVLFIIFAVIGELVYHFHFKK